MLRCRQTKRVDRQVARRRRRKSRHCAQSVRRACASSSRRRPRTPPARRESLPARARRPSGRLLRARVMKIGSVNIGESGNKLASTHKDAFANNRNDE